MKSNLIIVVVIFVTLKGFTQGFINLNFESAVIKLDTSSPYYPYAVVASNAIPGWTAYSYLNSTPQTMTSLLYNDIFLDGAGVDLEGTNSMYSPGVVEGNYSIYMQGGSQFITYTNGVAIGQIGQIPGTAQSITYWGNALQVTFNGHPLAFNAVGSGPNYTVWEADISTYAGQTGQLLFTAPWQSGGFLDNIQFSSSPVPEPSLLGLSALGGLFLACRRRKKSSA